MAGAQDPPAGANTFSPDCITGHVPRKLARHAFTLLGGMPSMDMLDIPATHVARRTTDVGLGVV